MTKVTIRERGEHYSAGDAIFKGIIVIKRAKRVVTSHFKYAGRYEDGLDLSDVEDGVIIGDRQLWEICRDSYGIIVFMRKGSHLSKDNFIEFLKSDYPEDYEFMLWNPEMLIGEYND